MTRRMTVIGTTLGFGLWMFAARAAPFELVATHIDAAAQPTAFGQAVRTLKPFHGKLYAGFGDYDINTGPIGIRAFDPSAGAFTSQLLSAQTEAVYLFREIGGKLYAPHFDPWPSPPPPGEMGGYSVGVASGSTESWSDLRLVPGIHIFDVATFNGDDLWMVGSRATAAGSEGVAWRSLDGGATWEVSLVLPPQRAGVVNSRIYAIQAYNGKLYTQGQDVEVWGPQSTSKVFDGTSWSNGTTLSMGFIGNMFHPEVFAGELVYHRLYGGAPGGSRISKFNGTRTAWAYTDEPFYDYTIADGVFYGLLADGRIVRTTDLVSWTLLDRAPAEGRSLGVLHNALYVGGTGGQLFRYSLPLSLSELPGDSNFNGTITITDYLAIDRGRAMRLTGWANGDFDLSGGVADADDYALIDRSFVVQVAVAPAGPTGAALPEPSIGLGLIVLGAVCVARRN